MTQHLDKVKSGQYVRGMPTTLQAIAIFLGWRSPCCFAPMTFKLGWSYKQDGKYCTSCDEMVR